MFLLHFFKFVTMSTWYRDNHWTDMISSKISWLEWKMSIIRDRRSCIMCFHRVSATQSLDCAVRSDGETINWWWAMRYGLQATVGRRGVPTVPIWKVPRGFSVMRVETTTIPTSITRRTVRTMDCRACTTSMKIPVNMRYVDMPQVLVG